MITEENFNINLCEGKRTKETPIYTNSELRNFLEKRNLSKNGNKSVLLNRINNYLNYRPYVIDCGGAGNCLFHVIAKILNELTGKKCNSDIVRQLTANSVTVKNIDSILENYCIEYKNNEEDFEWNPEEISECSSVREKTKELKSIIKTDGHTYEGDDVSLSLLGNSRIFKKHKLGIVIVTDSCQISFVNDLPYEPEIYSIIYNVGNYHWQLVGSRINKEKRVLFSEKDLDKIFDNFDESWFD